MVSASDMHAWFAVSGNKKDLGLDARAVVRSGDISGNKINGRD